MEENRTDFGKASHKPRSKKLKPIIDLTAMVSVSFLLIVFFMTAAELAKPKTLALGLPNGGCGHSYPRPDYNRVITLLLDDNNKIISYYGLLEVPNEPIKKLTYGKDSLRKELLQKSKMIKANDLLNGRPISGAMVFIKPSKKCNYGNLVDILDEMHIADIGTYAIVNDFTPEERALLAAN
jgi:biopolymer transport protein ExbD